MDPLQKSAAFDELEVLLKERIMFTDGAMGTQIQKNKLEEQHFRGERCGGGGGGGGRGSGRPAWGTSLCVKIPGRLRMGRVL